MTPRRLSVTQVRVAASCPRIAYFDEEHTRRMHLKQPRITRIWKNSGKNNVGLGSLFHFAVERFNRQACQSKELLDVLAGTPAAGEIKQWLVKWVYEKFVNHQRLFRAAAGEQASFMTALQTYLGEVAEILSYSLKEETPLSELLDQMFGDRRRRVDVTFHVGPQGKALNIAGSLDYVFFDNRVDRRRIIDYKLTPSEYPSNDLFQVCLYALMHNIQHGTRPDVAVLYLHPKRGMREKTWEQVYADRHKMYDFLASLLDWLEYDEENNQGLKPHGDPLYCSTCRYDKTCESRLGPKKEGGRLTHWVQTARADGDSAAEPAISAQEPLANEPPEVDDDEPAFEDSSSKQEEPVTPAVNSGASATNNKQTEPTHTPDEQLWIGELEETGQPISLPVQALPTHLTVVGAAGSGKTWLAKVIVEEAIRQGIPVIAVDPQGDLVQFLHQHPDETFPGDLPNGAREKFNQFRSQVEPRVFTPGSSHGIRLSLSPIRLPSKDDLHRITDAKRRDEEYQNILRSVATNLVEVAKAGGEQENQQTLIFEVLKRLSPKNSQSKSNGGVSMEDVVAGIFAPDSCGIEDADMYIRKAEREKLARKLTTLARGVSSHLFTGGMPLEIDYLRNPTQPNKTPLNVIYLNVLNSDDQKQFFVATLAAEIYRWMVTSQPTTKPQLLFYVDEARDYLPAGAKKPAAKTPIRRLFSQGRKYGVSCLICTQSPRSCDYEAFSNCSTKIIGRLESQQDVERVKEWFSRDGRAPEWLPQRKGAEKGTFIARWPEMPNSVDGQVIRSRKLFSKHESAWSPDRVETEMADHPMRIAIGVQ